MFDYVSTYICITAIQHQDTPFLVSLIHLLEMQTGHRYKITQQELTCRKTNQLTKNYRLHLYVTDRKQDQFF